MKATKEERKRKNKENKTKQQKKGAAPVAQPPGQEGMELQRGLCTALREAGLDISGLRGLNSMGEGSDTGKSCVEIGRPGKPPQDRGGAKPDGRVGLPQVTWRTVQKSYIKTNNKLQLRSRRMGSCSCVSFLQGLSGSH